MRSFVLLLVALCCAAFVVMIGPLSRPWTSAARAEPGRSSPPNVSPERLIVPPAPAREALPGPIVSTSEAPASSPSPGPVYGTAYTEGPAGLYWATSGHWQDDGLGEVTCAEAAALLGDAVPPGYDLSVGGRLADLLGGFPTLEDCEAAYRWQEVSDARHEHLELDLLVACLQERPRAERDEAFDAELARARGARNAALERLAALLERTTTYPHWLLLVRLARAWAPDG